MNTVSVIIPVYKAEKFLDVCIQSVLNQTYTDLEIILIDDGSPDNCGEKCDNWAVKDSRINVVHQNNKGGAASRNLALDICTGEFIAFVDSDDYIAPDFCEFLLSNFTDSDDIVECEYIKTEIDDCIFDNSSKEDVKRYSTEEAMGEHLSGKYFQQVIWNKIYRKSVIGNIRFVEGKQIDDEFWTYRVIGNARNLVHSDKCLYAYRQQDSSVMHSISIDRRFQTYEAIVQKHEYICEFFPKLVGQSQYNLWFAGMFYMQLLLRNDNTNCEHNMRYLKQVIKKYPITDYKGIKLSHKVWLHMAKLDFVLTCRIRNFLKIGI